MMRTWQFVIAALSLLGEQIVAIYTGRVRNWHTVGGADAPITVMKARPRGGRRSNCSSTISSSTPLRSARTS